jgi:hypothetical protein
LPPAISATETHSNRASPVHLATNIRFDRASGQSLPDKTPESDRRVDGGHYAEQIATSAFSPEAVQSHAKWKLPLWVEAV